MVTGSTITNDQITRVENDPRTSPAYVAKCVDALDPSTPPGRVNKDKAFIASAYNSEFPDPTVSFTSTDAWTAPMDVTEVAVECWGAGGGGGTSLITVSGGGGGGGGAYARSEVVSVTPGTTYTVTVGTSAGSSDGGDSWFMSTGTTLAKGGLQGSHGLFLTPGAGGLGGDAASCVGDTVRSGGAGSAGAALAAGAGGGSAGEDVDGNAASGTTPGAAPLFGGAAGSATGVGDSPGGGGAAGAILVGTSQAGGSGLVNLYY